MPCKQLRNRIVSFKEVSQWTKWGRNHLDQLFHKSDNLRHQSHLKQEVFLIHRDQGQRHSAAGLAGVCTMRMGCLRLLPGRQTYNNGNGRLSGNSKAIWEFCFQFENFLRSLIYFWFSYYLYKGKQGRNFKKDINSITLNVERESQ